MDPRNVDIQSENLMGEIWLSEKPTPIKIYVRKIDKLKIDETNKLSEKGVNT